MESRISFSDLAEFALGSKTAAALHEKTDADIRTCRRWLSEESKPPPNVIYLLFAEIARRAAL